MDKGSSNGIFARAGQGGTGIAFINREDVRATVVLTAYDSSGTAIAVETVVLAPREKVLDLAERVFDQDISRAAFISYASDAELLGFSPDPTMVRSLMDQVPTVMSDW